MSYARRLKNFMNAIYLYSIADNKSTQVTDGMSDARYPAFDKDGKFLYFTASTDSGPSLQSDIQSFTRPVSRSIYLLVLSKDEPSPLAPESDDEKEDKKPNEMKAEDAAKTTEDKGVAECEKKPEPGKAPAPPKPIIVKIDFDNISQRILALPMPPRHYVSLQVGNGVLFAVEAPSFTPNGFGEGPGPGLTVHRFDLKSRKSDVATSGVNTLEISLNGKKMLYRQAEKWYIAAPKPMAAPGAAPPPTPPAAASSGLLKTEGLEIRVDPKAAWSQMYREAWRIERDTGSERP
jgi:tricorn protease